MRQRTTTARSRWAGTIFSTWVVLGLFLDGWAHNAGKPEGFWTPWHAVLYSGFLAGAGWFALERWRGARAGDQDEPLDRHLVMGFAVFALAGLGDAVWHSVFGVEEDVAALLSPTHLALMLGGLLLITGPIRGARELPAPERRWRTFLPVAVSVVLTVSLVGFFLQFASPFHVTDHTLYATAVGDTGGPIHGVTAVLLTNLLLTGGVAWLLARWPRPPAGTLTFVLATTGLLVSSLLAFETVVLAVAPAVGGLVGDVIVHRGGSRRTVLLAVPVVTWSTWFALYDIVWDLGWEAELWTGSVALAVLTGAGVDLLVRVGTRPDAADRDQLVPGTQVGDAEPDPRAMRVEELGAHAGSVTSR